MITSFVDTLGAMLSPKGDQFVRDIASAPHRNLRFWESGELRERASQRPGGLWTKSKNWQGASVAAATVLAFCPCRMRWTCLADDRSRMTRRYCEYIMGTGNSLILRTDPIRFHDCACLQNLPDKLSESRCWSLRAREHPDRWLQPLPPRPKETVLQTPPAVLPI